MLYHSPRARRLDTGPGSRFVVFASLIERLAFHPVSAEPIGLEESLCPW